ncbi:FAD/NAD(P)-binding protein [Gangjinia marincola]|uniref:FAD/NAD(P)-binding protein n=1 Tax=Gangjinia marincola TaxID=578463 RepID=A0ABP3XXH5_9FLAO
MNIAIIGFGPRGLSSLEQLIVEASQSNLTALKILMFDPSDVWATGSAWDIQQPDTNRINISDRALQDLPGREQLDFKGITIPAFPNYTQWCKEQGVAIDKDTAKDAYPPRKQMGRYLFKRAQSIMDILMDHQVVDFIQKEIVQLDWKAPEITLVAGDESTYTVAACVLTMGHLPLEKEERTRLHIQHAKKEQAIYIDDPYAPSIMDMEVQDQNVIVIGYGLTMIDVMRKLSSAKGGSFVKEGESLRYQFSGKEPAQLIPFSNDGLPCVAKPLGKAIDDQFTPPEALLSAYKEGLRKDIETLAEAFTLEDFTGPTASLVASVYVKLHAANDPKEIAAQLLTWWDQRSLPANNHLFTDPNLSAQHYLKKCIEMARGNSAFTLDYVAGQVWRQLHPFLYEQFDHSPISAAALAALIDLDEFMKRYTYGPPVESLLQVHELIRQNLIAAAFLDDPELKRVSGGWELNKGNKTVKASILINSVLNAPDMQHCSDPLIRQLFASGYVQAVHEGLGIETLATAQVVGKEDVPLYALGRIAKGNVLGTDAILECFNREIPRMAKAVLARGKTRDEELGMRDGV